MKHPLYFLILSFPVIPIVSNPLFEECEDKQNCCVSENYKVEDLFYAVDQYEGIELCKKCHDTMLYLCWKFDDAEYAKNGCVSYENSVDQYNKHIIKQKKNFSLDDARSYL